MHFLKYKVWAIFTLIFACNISCQENLKNNGRDNKKIDSLGKEYLVLQFELPDSFKDIENDKKPKFFPLNESNYTSERCNLFDTTLNMGFIYIRFNDWLYKEYVKKFRDSIYILQDIETDYKFNYNSIYFFQNKFEYINGYKFILTEYRTLYGKPDTMFYHMDLICLLNDTYAKINIIGAAPQDSVLNEIKDYAHLIKNSIRVIEKSKRDSTRMSVCVDLN
ncbi:MAG: hypothetical protein WAU21_08585 [Chitinophagales bacterium]|nr:hypothetical protein [Bacteroidota bacterium]MBK8486379.1 hypothetical protein [Bacteroidota bacterium]MBK8683159.1 hypothetical protein [Bacteroidota bacterium]